MLHFQIFKTALPLQNSVDHFCVDIHVWSLEIVPFLSYLFSRTISSEQIFLCLPIRMSYKIFDILCPIPRAQDIQIFLHKSTPGIFKTERKVAVWIFITHFLWNRLSLSPNCERCIRKVTGAGPFTGPHKPRQ
jgi:hypothetical protein